MKLLLVYPPFCSPASPPYSITNLARMMDADVIDLNILFHKIKFPKFHEFYSERMALLMNGLKHKGDKGNIRNEANSQDYYLEYDRMTKEFVSESSKVYSTNNKKVIEGQRPELLDEMIVAIMEKNMGKKPEAVALSIVYSSQAFYAIALIDELKIRGIKVYVGGPAVNEKLSAKADAIELQELLNMYPKETSKKLDYSAFKDDYFTPKVVLPLKTCSGCYHSSCSFCTHHQGVIYQEFPLEDIEETIKDSVNNGNRYFFMIDDMMNKKRLLELSDIMKRYDASWMVQLRPGKEYDPDTMKRLSDSGLRSIIWGVESGCDRILKLMRKATSRAVIESTLKNSHEAGIKNVVYVMFGFPTESEDEFLETISMLKNNAEYIDLISSSIFGLHKGTDIYNNPKKYGITSISEQKRTILEPKISYKVSVGLSQEDVIELKNNYKKTIEKMNRYPKGMNFFREHMLISA